MFKVEVQSVVSALLLDLLRNASVDDSDGGVGQVIGLSGRNFKNIQTLDGLCLCLGNLGKVPESGSNHF